MKYYCIALFIVDHEWADKERECAGHQRKISQICFRCIYSNISHDLKPIHFIAIVYRFLSYDPHYFYWDVFFFFLLLLIYKLSECNVSLLFDSFFRASLRFVCHCQTIKLRSNAEILAHAKLTKKKRISCLQSS